MKLKWIDTLEIAMALDDVYPKLNPEKINFVDLRQKIMDLDEFDDAPAHCGERILEAIQQTWIEEKEN